MKKKASTSLGKRGWLIVFSSFLLFMLGTGLVTDFLNVSVASIAERNGGWDTALMLTISSVAGWVTLAVAIVAGVIVQKKGARKVMFISTLCFTIAVFFLGSVTQLWQYVICIFVISIADAVQSGMAMQTVIAAWFPTKKGIAMGWATLGLNMSTIAFLPFFNWLNGSFGVAKAYYVIGVICLAVCIFNYINVRDFPEQAGQAPDNSDNFDREATAAEAKKIVEYTRSSPWTIGKLLRTKQVWQVSLMLGCGMMVATGVLGQFVPRMASLGIDVHIAVSMLSLCCIVGIFFSPTWGYLDNKFGAKKITSVMLILYLVALLLMIVAGSNVPVTCISLCIFFGSLGGINNMLTSYTTSVFGRYDFASANRVMYPIYNVVRCCAFGLVGISSKLADGNYTVTYLLMAACLVAAIIASFFTKDTMIGRSAP